MNPDDADTLAVALLNGPAQLTEAFDNLATVLNLLASDDPQRATVAGMLDDASGRIADLRAAL